MIQWIYNILIYKNTILKFYKKIFKNWVCGTVLSRCRRVLPVSPSVTGVAQTLLMKLCVERSHLSLGYWNELFQIKCEKATNKGSTHSNSSSSPISHHLQHYDQWNLVFILFVYVCWCCDCICFVSHCPPLSPCNGVMFPRIHQQHRVWTSPGHRGRTPPHLLLQIWPL